MWWLRPRLLQRFFSVYYERNSLGGLGNGDVDDNDNVKKTNCFYVQSNRSARASHDFLKNWIIG